MQPDPLTLYGFGERPYYDGGDVVLYHGDCRELLANRVPGGPHIDAIVTDPPYGDTTLEWDRWAGGWASLLPADQAWVFGSMRMWLDHARDEFQGAGWKLAQDVVWEKHNGSGFAADRFRRVHEHALHWYRGEWGALHHDVPTTGGHSRKIVAPGSRNGQKHTGTIAPSTGYDRTDRLMRTVIHVRSEQGRAVHPTQKPLGILTPLIEYSVPQGGFVLDPFAGSGSTLVAARMAGRRAIGIEANEQYLERAVERLAQQSLLGGDAA